MRKGDKIKFLNGVSTVVCVIKFKQPDGVAKLCTLNSGLKITPKHPVLVEGQRVYPKELVASQVEKCEEVFILVVESDHMVIINDLPVISLGHTYSHSILKHDYLGS